MCDCDKQRVVYYKPKFHWIMVPVWLYFVFILAALVNLVEWYFKG